MKTVAVVLAAGKGTRMDSDLPKVLHRLSGRPLVAYPLAAAAAVGVERFIVVIGHGAEAVEHACRAEGVGPIEFAVQPEQNGTGHAVSCALPALGAFEGMVMILSGDVPLLEVSTLERLVRCAEQSPGGLGFVTFRPADPTGYGRIIRNAEGKATSIREHRDATQEERAIGECNAGVYCVSADALRRELPRLGSANAQGEIYFTDLVQVLGRMGAVGTLEVDPLEVAGVNTIEQLAVLQAELTRRSG